jgi:hypothetical protein
VPTIESVVSPRRTFVGTTPSLPLLLIKSGNGAEFLQSGHLRACANLHLGFELIALLDCSNTDRKEFRIFHMARVYL